MSRRAGGLRPAPSAELAAKLYQPVPADLYFIVSCRDAARRRRRT